MREIIAMQVGQLLECHRQRLQQLNSVRGLELWRDAIVHGVGLQVEMHGCESSSLTEDLENKGDDVRSELAEYLKPWEELFSAGFERMRERGVIRPESDVAKLTTSFTAVLLGGYLLARTARDVTPMKIALDIALDNVRTYISEPDAPIERT
jgi:hypothetical protein